MGRSGGSSGGGRSFGGRSGGSGSRGGSGHYGGGYYYGMYDGCSLSIIKEMLFYGIICFLLVTISNRIEQKFPDITPSTIAREALPVNEMSTIDYYTDELGWIENKMKLMVGMRKFYKQTGVQPYLYITDKINGSPYPTYGEAEAFARSTYDRLFTDESHFLFVFLEYGGRYHMWYMGGSQTKTIMDEEAADILMDYVDFYYNQRDLTEEEVFSKAFDKTGERIMKVTRAPMYKLIVAAFVIAALSIAFAWLKKHKKQKSLEQKQMQEILNMARK